MREAIPMSDIAPCALLALAVTVLGRLAVDAFERIGGYVIRKLGYRGSND